VIDGEKLPAPVCNGKQSNSGSLNFDPLKSVLHHSGTAVWRPDNEACWGRL